MELKQLFIHPKWINMLLIHPLRSGCHSTSWARQWRELAHPTCLTPQNQKRPWTISWVIAPWLQMIWLLQHWMTSGMKLSILWPILLHLSGGHWIQRPVSPITDPTCSELHSGWFFWWTPWTFESLWPSQRICHPDGWRSQPLCCLSCITWASKLWSMASLTPSQTLMVFQTILMNGWNTFHRQNLRPKAEM